MKISQLTVGVTKPTYLTFSKNDPDINAVLWYALLFSEHLPSPYV